MSFGIYSVSIPEFPVMEEKHVLHSQNGYSEKSASISSTKYSTEKLCAAMSASVVHCSIDLLEFNHFAIAAAQSYYCTVP